MTEPATAPAADSGAELVADPGHLLPADEWAAVVAGAQEHATAGLAAPRALGASAFAAVTGVVTAKYNGGRQPEGRPFFGVLHSAETPLAPGYAASIAGYFTRNTNSTSAHFMAGPDGLYQLLDTGLVAWHCGNGNTRSVGVEQAGYAAFTAAQWQTPDGLAQMGRIAELMRELRAVHGIGLYWMSDAQLLAAYRGQQVGGWATHDQCRRVLGGTSHTDPMPNYPLQALIDLATGGAVTPTPTPTPAPPAPVPAVPGLPAWPATSSTWTGRDRFGLLTDPSADVHGGFYSWERPYVQAIQRRLIAKGYVPGVTDWRSGWADGRFGPETVTAVTAFQHRELPGTTFYGQVWADDWARLAR